MDPTVKAFALMLFLYFDVRATQQTDIRGDEGIADN